MADNTFITGAAEGAFAAAFDGIPPWATENTAQSIEAYLLRSLGVQTKTLTEVMNLGSGTGANGMSPESAKKVNDELETLFKTLKKDNDELTKAGRDRKAKKKADDAELNDKKQLKTSGQKAMYVLSGFASAGNKVLAANRDYIDVYDSMYRSGINVMNGNDTTADGFLALNQLVIQTGLRLQTLQAVAEKYSTTMNVMGMSKFGKAVGLSTEQLKGMGYSSTASAELVGAMMDAEMGFSDIRSKSADAIAKDAISTGKQFDKLSQTVGVSREQLLDNMKVAARASNATMIAAAYSQTASENVLKATAGFKDQGLAAQLTDIISAYNPVYSQIMQDLTNVGLGAFGNQLASVTKDMLTDDPSTAMRKQKQLAEQITSSQITNLAAIKATGGPQAASASAALDFITKYQQQARNVSDASNAQADAARNTESSIAGLQTETEKLSAAVQAAFPPLVSQVNALAGAMQILNDKIYAGIDSVQAETRSWVGAGLIAASLGMSLLLARGSISTFLSLFSGLGTGVSAVTSSLGTISSIILQAGKLVGIFTALALVIGGTFDFVAGLFGVGNKKIDKTQDDANWDRMSALEKIESGLARSVETVSSALFMGNMANEASDNRIKAETEYLNKKLVTEPVAPQTGIPPKPVIAPKSREISIPKTPAASTIDSPSAVKTPTRSESSASPPDTPGAATVAPVIDKPGNNNSINSLLSYHGSILEQILLSTTDLVSVNKDILRYTRNRQ